MTEQEQIAAESQRLAQLITDPAKAVTVAVVILQVILPLFPLDVLRTIGQQVDQIFPPDLPPS